MEVTLNYAEQHLAELVTTLDAGDPVVIARDGKLPLLLSLAEGVAAPSTRTLLGAARGRIWLADNWDSI